MLSLQELRRSFDLSQVVQIIDIAQKCNIRLCINYGLLSLIVILMVPLSMATIFVLLLVGTWWKLAAVIGRCHGLWVDLAATTYARIAYINA